MQLISKQRVHRLLHTMLCLSLGVMGLVFLIACTPPEPSSASRWEVQPGLYSGRENPQRLLTVEESQQFEAMLAELPAGAVIERGGLGYQGFIVRQVGKVGGNGIRRVMVYEGIVEVNHTNGVYYLGDPDRTLEQWLFDTTKGILSEGETQVIEADLKD